MIVVAVASSAEEIVEVDDEGNARVMTTEEALISKVSEADERMNLDAMGSVSSSAEPSIAAVDQKQGVVASVSSASKHSEEERQGSKALVSTERRRKSRLVDSSLTKPGAASRAVRSQQGSRGDDGGISVKGAPSAHDKPKKKAARTRVEQSGRSQGVVASVCDRFIHFMLVWVFTPGPETNHRGKKGGASSQSIKRASSGISVRFTVGRWRGVRDMDHNT